MSSPNGTPAPPLLRIPVPSSRSQSGNRAPRLGLSIPASPSTKPVDSGAVTGDVTATDQPQPQKPAPPMLSLATPQGSSAIPEVRTDRGRRPDLANSLNLNTLSGSSERTPQSRSRSSSEELTGNGPSSLNMYAQIQLPQRSESRDPISAGSKSSDGGVNVDKDLAVDLEKLRISKGRPLDVEDLDDAAWKAMSAENKIVEISSLGEGAGGAVTKCVLDGGKVVFALKVITTDPNPDVKKQIVREVNFNKKIVSEHICRYYGAFMNDVSSTISIAMEYCEGGSLDGVYKEVKKQGGRTGEKVLGKVAEGVLKGLTYLHKNRILHRDIKPSNILLSRNGGVKLCDFGVSGESRTLGDADTFIGTSYYMAPERIQGQTYTITSDVWSLGVSLLEVAQNRFPFPEDGDETQPKAGIFELVTYIVAKPLPKLKDEPDKGISWSDNFKSFIEYCLERQGDKRASPWKMLEHPWIVDIQSRRVHIDRFLKSVWQWKEDEQQNGC